MGRENDPLYRRRHPKDRDEQKYEYDDDYKNEYNGYEDDAPNYIDESEYNNRLNRPTSNEQTPNIPKRRSGVSPPPQPHYTERRTMRTPKRIEYIEERAQPTPRRTAKPTQRITQQAALVARKAGEAKLAPPKSISRKQHKQRIWPIFLIGCASGAASLVIAIAVIFYLTYRSVQNGSLTIPGVINTNKPYSQSTTQTVPLKLVSQVVVCNRAGNVSLKVDQNPNATSPTVTTTKTVYADNQDHAQQQLNKIAVEVQPPNQLTKPLACQKPQTATSSSPSTTAIAKDTTLIVNITFPADEVGETVDVAIVLPSRTVQTPSPIDNLISIEAPLGDISIDGMSGMMILKSVTKDISVQHSVLVDGSHISTEGNITFNGALFTIPIKQGQPAHYILSSGHQLDVTLPDNTNLIVAANTNVGKISSDFPITPIDNDGNRDASYHGPLEPSNQIDPKTDPLLTLSASTGNISIHKAKSP
jgi:hypothetical protein